MGGFVVAVVTEDYLLSPRAYRMGSERALAAPQSRSRWLWVSLPTRVFEILTPGCYVPLGAPMSQRIFQNSHSGRAGPSRSVDRCQTPYREEQPS